MQVGNLLPDTFNRRYRRDTDIEETYHSFKTASTSYCLVREEFLKHCSAWMTNDSAYEQFSGNH